MSVEAIKNKYIDLINKALNIIKENDEPVHGIGHISGVVENTILLLEKYPEADKEVCILSAYWHDVGRKYGKKGHELKSAEMLKEELINNGYDEEFADKCFKAIYKTCEKDLPETLEGILVRDADKLDDLGIARWKECIEKNKRPPRVIVGLRNELLQLDYSKELYDIKAEKWLKYIRSVVLGEEN